SNSQAAVRESTTTFHLSYIPVAVFVGGTSGVGQGMTEAFARYVQGCAHIIIVGRNARAAADIITRFPKPDDGEWKHEFVSCEVDRMDNVRAACKIIREKVKYVNFLVITAGYSTMVNNALARDGLDLLLAMRCVLPALQELLPLIQKAQELAQDAKVISMLSGGMSRPIDLANLGNTVKPRNGRFRVSLRGMIMSSYYTDAMLAHFAAESPGIAFTHIRLGVVKTSALRVEFDGLLLSWLLTWISWRMAVSQMRCRMNPRSSDKCAEHMLYTLFTGERGLFIRNRYGDVIS
ncbi:hypothetical protein B0H17DRAFT_852581, partial [Mycena rosella]